ncbi:hypothetical protein E8E13_009675 [Curvularia kusanoi]|uniref:Amino acid permease/ SLC12A domain-containing protein n=1 Tax=Curvularia kusanoi TaxID=90978 RepID=A0A9P4TGQ6_CURKU|nr:hypothetical protein E8E13_009675 [Curvularia kusanoi]
MFKGPSNVTDACDSIELANAIAVGEKHGTQRDERDMDRMGKLQELRRQFKFLTVFGFSILLGNTWPYALIGIGISLYNGGPAGGIWLLVVVCFGMFFVTLSLAEMVSMAPTAGGQYHWISEFSPKKYQKILSYITAEEVKDAAWVSPRAMISTSVVSYSLAFTMTVTVFSTMGTNLSEVLETPLGQPWIQIVLNATGSIVATNVLVVVICMLLMFSAVNQVTASSRQLWSFARDQGLPFSTWLSYVPPGFNIPVNSIVSTLVATALLSLINIGSGIAFNIVIALGSLGLQSANIIVIGLMLRKRIAGEPLLPSMFDLGRAGIAVNTIAFLYLLLIIVMICFPSVPNPALADMNWCSVMFGGLLTFAMIYYYFYGRHKYDGPVEYVKQS